MRLPDRRRAGFTFVEAMMVVAILGILALVGPRLMTAMYQFFTQSISRSDIQRDIRAALDVMNRQIRQASAATITVSQESGQPPYSKISFTMPDGVQMTYKQIGRMLVQVTGNGVMQPWINNVEYIAFTYPRTDDNTVISISITLKKKTFGTRTTALQMAITKVRVMNP